VLLSFADGDQSREEIELVKALAKRLRISDAECETLMNAGTERAKKYLNLL
jgi:hypothetical protein